jgi:hypothetical protein
MDHSNGGVQLVSQSFGIVREVQANDGGVG